MHVQTTQLAIMVALVLQGMGASVKETDGCSTMWSTAILLFKPGLETAIIEAPNSAAQQGKAERGFYISLLP